MIALALLINFASICIAYGLGKAHRTERRLKPKSVFCDLEFDTAAGRRICKRVHVDCVSGLCKMHCKERCCNCHKAMTAEEKEILEETRKVLGERRR